MSGSTTNRILAFADELERRDGEVAARLAEVERLEREVEELRLHAAEVASFLVSVPDALQKLAVEERAARDARTRAETTLREAEARAGRARREDERLAAERDARQARDDVHAAERWVEEARGAAGRLERDRDARAGEGRALAARAAELGARVADVTPPAAGLEGTVEWASRARGALLVERSGLARERDAVVREASELLGSVLGEPFATSAVVDVRRRLERALGAASA